MWFWVGRVRFDAKIIDAVAAAAGGRGIFSGGCGFVAFAGRRQQICGIRKSFDAGCGIRVLARPNFVAWLDLNFCRHFV